MMELRTHVCEAFVVVLRYLTGDWELKQCVGRLKLLAKTMTGEEIAQQIIVILSSEFGISSNLIVATMHDRAFVVEDLNGSLSTFILLNSVVESI